MCGLWLGTTDGIWCAEASGAPVRRLALAGRAVLQLLEDDRSTVHATDGHILWQTEDAWGHVTESLLPDGRPITALAASPHPPYPLFAGSIPATLARSDDAGRSWRMLSSFEQTPGYREWTFPGPSPHPRVNAIAFDAVDPALIYVTVEVGGIIRSADGGETWENCSEAINRDAHFLSAHPEHAGVIFASMGFGSGQPGGVYRSTDRGTTWRYDFDGLSPSYTRPILLDSRAREHLYVAATPQQPPFWAQPDGPGAVLWRGDTADGQWQVVFPVPTEGTEDRSRLISALCLDPHLLDGIYLATGDFTQVLHAVGALGRPPGGPFLVGSSPAAAAPAVAHARYLLQQRLSGLDGSERADSTGTIWHLSADGLIESVWSDAPVALALLPRIS